QGSGQKRRHLFAGHRVVGTEPIVPRRIASPRDAGVCQRGDVPREHRAGRVGEQAPPPESPRARTRKAAIWPRVTDSSGQKRSFFGGLHPRVTPTETSQAMSSAKTLSTESTNTTRSPTTG